MAEDNVKTIRDLSDFTEEQPISTGDYLIVATSQGVAATNKASIKSVVENYFAESASQNDDQEDFIEVDGQLVPNPLKNATTTVQGVDTDGDGIIDSQVEVVTTPITSNNIDSLIDPGSGLEVTELCQDENFAIVDCEVDGLPNPAVKYKSKKLGLATSDASKKIILYCNDGGDEYDNGTFTVGSGGIVQARFKRLRDAFKFIRNDVAASDTVIDINIETDLDEGDINHTNETYFSHNNAEINKCYINILAGGYGDGLQPKKIKLKTVNNPATNNAYVAMWFNAINVNFFFVHLILDLDDNRGVHAAIRSYKLCALKLFGCKISIRGTCHKFFDASRGATAEIANLSDNDLDPLNKQFWAPALEIDIGPRKSDATEGSGSIGDNFYCDYVFAGDTGAVLRFPEYGSHIPWNAAFNTVFQSRIHFASNRLDCNSFFSLESNCMVDIIALFTMSTGLSFGATNVPYFLRAAAFNSVTLRNGYHMKGTLNGAWAELANSFPGDQLANPTTQFGGTSTAGQDYIMTNNISPNNNLLTTYKGEDESGNPTAGDLTNYWDNVDWATI